MTSDDFGLERILERKRYFLIDTNVVFGGTSGDNRIEDDVTRLAADLSFQHTRFRRMKAVFEVIRQQDNVRVTPEVRNEILSKMASFKGGYTGHKKKERLIEAIDGYFRHHPDLLLGADYWSKTPMAQVGWILEEEIRRRHPELKKLSRGDISLLLKALEVRLPDNHPYQKTDIISADYGVIIGAQVLFSILQNLSIPNVATPKQLRRVHYRCINIISRHYMEDYHIVFDSVQYCNSLRKGSA